MLSRLRLWLSLFLPLVLAASIVSLVATTQADAAVHQTPVHQTPAHQTPVNLAFHSAALTPSGNITPNPAYPGICQSAPSSSSCQNTAIAALNNARAAMGLPAYNLPMGFQSMSTAQQFLVLSNLDRLAYGLTPIAGLNSTLNNVAASGVASDTDPAGPATVEGNRFTSWTSNWAAGWASPLYTYYEWMYDDGYGSSNADCSSPSAPGCWGHRASTLHNFGGSLVLMGVGAGTSPRYHLPAFTELYEGFAANAAISYQPALPPAPLAEGVVDVTGDGKADVVDVYPNAVYVQPSAGSSFGAAAQWSNQLFYGTRNTTMADVNGDGKKDIIAVNGGSIWVMLSTGSGFGAPQLWSTSLFYGAFTTTFADVNGDGKADAVAINGGSIWVMLSTGSGFGAPQLWSPSLFYGALSTTMVDVNGDGRADAVAINGNSVWVMLSTGGGFGAPQLGSASLFWGNRSTAVADVNGDGKADVVAVNDGSVWVMLSYGSTFSSPQLWSSQLFYGSQATTPGDVNGDGKADVVAVNYTNLFVVVSNGSSLGAATAWF